MNIVIRTRAVGTPSVAATAGSSRMAIASRLAAERAIQMPISITTPRVARYTQNTLRWFTAAE